MAVIKWNICRWFHCTLLNRCHSARYYPGPVKFQELGAGVVQSRVSEALNVWRFGRIGSLGDLSSQIRRLASKPCARFIVECLTNKVPVVFSHAYTIYSVYRFVATRRSP